MVCYFMKEKFFSVSWVKVKISFCSTLLCCCSTDAVAFSIAHPRHLHHLCLRPSLSSKTLTFTISLLLLFPYSTVTIWWKIFVFTSLLYTAMHQFIISIPLCNPYPSFQSICSTLYNLCLSSVCYIFSHSVTSSLT